MPDKLTRPPSQKAGIRGQTAQNRPSARRYNVEVKPNIIFVEDDPDISRLVKHHLEQASFYVRPFNTGASVIAEAEKGRPALFLLDIMVPGGDGLELCRQIR